MSYPFFFLDRADIKNGKLILSGQDRRHLVNVLRCKAGDQVNVSDNEKYRYRTRIGEINKKWVELIIEDRKPLNKPGYSLSVFQCILKRNAMETAIQKVTEIGADTITPVYSSRVVADPKKAFVKLERWQKISDEASRQCKRDYRCSVLQPVEITDIKVEQYDLFYLLYEGSAEAGDSLKDSADMIKKYTNIAFIVGPEGGFEESEACSLKNMGARQVSLGKNILRAETAAIYFLSVLDFLIST